MRIPSHPTRGARLRPLGLAALVLMLGSCAAMQKAELYKMQLKPYSLNGLDYPMPSGLRLFFQEDHDQASVVVVDSFSVGATQDPEGLEGLAHVVEHLCFRARHQGADKPTVWESLDAMGSVSNAFTNSDQTTYFSIAPRSALPELMRLEADRIANPIEGVTEKVLKTEIEVVRNELRQRVEMSDLGRSLEDLNPMLYPKGHPYHRSIIGSHDSLSRITLADVQAWVDKYYKPSNATVVVVGDFDPKSIPPLIGKSFPPKLVADPKHPDAPLKLIAQTPRVRGDVEEPPTPVEPASKKIRHTTGPVNATTVIVAWSLPSAYHGKDEMLEALAQQFIMAISSLLDPKSMYEKEKVEGLGCSLQPGLHASMMLCFVQPSEDMDPETTARKAIDGAWNVWDANTANISKMRLSRTRVYGMADTFLETASLMRAMQIANSIQYSGVPNAFSKAIKEYNDFNFLEMRQFAQKYLNRARAVAMVIEPYGKDEKGEKIALDTDAGWAGALLAEADSMKPFFEKLDGKTIAAATVAPDPATMKSFTLPNGLKVVLDRHGNTPFIQAALRFRGGTLMQTPYFASNYIGSRDDARNPLQVGGRGDTSSGKIAEGFSVSVPSGNLPAALDILATKAETIRPDYESEARRYQIKRERKLRQIDARNHTHQLHRAVMAAIAPGHPLAVTEGELDAIAPLDEAYYQRWFKKEFAPANATLFVVGELDLEEAALAVRKRFSAWRATDPGKRFADLPPLPAPPTRELLVADRVDATQMELQLVCQLPKATLQNEEAREVLSTMLSDDLFQTIRKRAGASYGIYASPRATPGGASLLMVGGNIMVEKAIPALKTILSRMQEIADGKIDLARFNKARWKIARSSHSRYMGLGSMLAQLEGQSDWGLAPQSLSKIPERLAKVTPEQVSALLAPCVGHEVIGVVAPKATLGRELAQIGRLVDVKVEKAPATATDK